MLDESKHRHRPCQDEGARHGGCGHRSDAHGARSPAPHQAHADEHDDDKPAEDAQHVRWLVAGGIAIFCTAAMRWPRDRRSLARDAALSLRIVVSTPPFRANATPHLMRRDRPAQSGGQRQLPAGWSPAPSPREGARAPLSRLLGKSKAHAPLSSRRVSTLPTAPLCRRRYMVHGLAEPTACTLRYESASPGTMFHSHNGQVCARGVSVSSRKGKSPPGGGGALARGTSHSAQRVVPDRANCSVCGRAMVGLWLRRWWVHGRTLGLRGLDRRWRGR